MAITTHDLWVDGRATKIALAKSSSSPTTIQLSWTLPTNKLAYDGAVVLLSESPITVDQYPVDSTRYTGSSNWDIPVDTLNGAKVVAAFYGFFGDNIAQSSVTVTNVDPDKLYYASIHICSNILQYYSVGSYSYPIEANDPAKDVSPYAGSIQQTSFAPENPYNGQVYFDTSTSAVMIWNDEQSAWIKIEQNTVEVGAIAPVNKAQLFYSSPQREFQYFDGTDFVTVSTTNLRCKMGATWIPFYELDWQGVPPQNPPAGTFAWYTDPVGIFAAPRRQYFKYYSIGQWFIPSPDLVQVLIDGEWVPIFAFSLMENQKPIPDKPYIGMFFYQSSTKDLMVWDGFAWVKADTADDGVPAKDKLNVGTDGSIAARLDLGQNVKMRMGYPSVCVELKEENFQVAINNALAEFRRRADNAYTLNYVSYTLNRGQSTYYLNDPRDKTNKIVNVIRIHRINMLGISSLSAENGLYSQAFFNQLYQGSNVDILSIHLMNQLSESFERIFAGHLMFTWNEASREMIILRNMAQKQERVILEVSMEREEQELIYDRWAGKWIQDWAYAEVMEMLGWIRTKYTTLPGANGGITMNGQELLNSARDLKAELLRQINDFEVGNGGVEFLNTAFLIG